MISKFQSIGLAAVAALTAVPISQLSAGPTKSSKSITTTRMFKVDRRVFSGTAKTICVIEGKWADGEYFRYEAWDRCADMSMRRTSHSEFKDEESYGNEDDPKITDIPLKSEVLEVSNDSSSVLLFRDRKGVMREITISD